MHHERSLTQPAIDPTKLEDQVAAERLLAIEHKARSVIEAREKFKQSQVLGSEQTEAVISEIRIYIGTQLTNGGLSSYVEKILNPGQPILVQPQPTAPQLETALQVLAAAEEAYCGLAQGKFNSSAEQIANNIISKWDNLRRGQDDADADPWVRNQVGAQLKKVVELFDQVNSSLDSNSNH